MQITLDRAEHDETVLKTDLQRLSTEIAVMEKGLPFANHEPEMWDYNPRVILPLETNQVAVVVIGPKISTAEPKIIQIGNGSLVKVDKTTDNELILEIPRSEITFTDGGSNYVRYQLVYKISRSKWWNPSTWGKSDDIQRELVFWAVPRKMGQYTITPKVQSTSTDRQTFHVDIAPHGMDSTYPYPVPVPPYLQANGWVIDAAALLNTKWGNPAQDGGSSCAGVDPNSITQTGFVYRVQLGHKNDGGHKSDGMAECRAEVPLIRKNTQTVTGTVIKGDLNWIKDVAVDLPPETQEYKIELTMFDGRSYVITDDAAIPFGLTEVKRQGNKAVLFRPHQPRDF